jgi:hypothetical protein
MKFAIHRIGAGRVINQYFGDESETLVYLMEALRTEELMGGPNDYTIEPCDDNGNQLEKVPKEDQQKAASDAKELVENHKDFSMAVQVMVGARQTYAAAVNELERLFANIPDDEKPHPETIEVLIQSAAYQGSQPFDERDLFVGLEKTIQPWLKRMAMEHEREDHSRKLKAEKEQDDRRRAVPVDIGFSVERNGDKVITRDKPIVLIGYRPAIMYLLDKAVAAALSSVNGPKQFQVMRMTNAEIVLASEAQPSLVKSARSKWEGVGKSNDRTKLMFAGANKSLNRLVDLVVCDELPAVCDPKHDRAHSVSCAEGCKRLMDSCKITGAALVAGICLPSMAIPDLSHPEWERLRTHSILRPVQVSESDDGKRTITVGKDADEFVVDSEILDWVGPVTIP